MEEFLTVEELSSRIKIARQTIYNLIYKNEFTLGLHYLKPTPKKILFKWSEITKWMQESSEPSIAISSEYDHNRTNITSKKSKNRIIIE